jgi:hypothetical protein
MQWSFSLNNFGAHPSASNPGDGSSDVVLVVSLKGKNKIEQNRTKENKKQKKKPHKVFQVQMQYSFSKFFSMQV